MVEPLRTNEELLAIIGPWAKEHHPDKYRATLQQVAKPQTFRNYLIRLIEIRLEEENVERRRRAAAGEPPLEYEFWLDPALTADILDATSLARTLKIKSTGDAFVVAGKGYKGPLSVSMSWSMLAVLTDNPGEFHALAYAMKTLDLELIRDP
jgi:hypothetical protein